MKVDYLSLYKNQRSKLYNLLTLKEQEEKEINNLIKNLDYLIDLENNKKILNKVNKLVKEKGDLVNE